MTPQAYLYICDGNVDNPVLTHKKMDWPEKYSHWQEIPLVMAQRSWVGLTDNEADEVYRAAQEQINEYWESGGSTIMFPTMLYKAIESKLKDKNK